MHEGTVLFNVLRRSEAVVLTKPFVCCHAALRAGSLWHRSVENQASISIFSKIPLCKSLVVSGGPAEETCNGKFTNAQTFN